METPSSTTRRVTRSQTTHFKKLEESESKTKQMSGKKDRSALVDITNDSPIVGLAMGSLETPSLAISKTKRIVISSGQLQPCSRTPGSGEALLRGQVKTLLQKVEEEAEISKFVINKRPFFTSLHGISLVAPTPANTPQVFSSNNDVTGMFLIPEGVSEAKKVEAVIECEEDMVTRSLLFDFSDKSDSSECSSVLTYQGAAIYGDTDSSCKTDDDDSSIWSIQVNASSTRDDDDDEGVEEEDYLEEECDDNYGDEEEEYGDDEGLMLDELCAGISNINVKEDVEFRGKHIRFVYNSEDDEIEGEAEVLHLKGLPTPQGKHLRFPTDDDC